MSKNFDIILYGASSYTAGFIIPHLENQDLNIALAARTIEKIPPTNLKTIECSIESAVKQCKILINCVGPYHKNGEEVIAACLKHLTHYIDICGETQFIKHIIDKYNYEATVKNLFIIQACGFDSLIADIGTEILKNNFDRDVEIRSILELKNCSANFGTWESLINSLSTFHQCKKTNFVRENKNKAPEYYYDQKLKSYVVKFRGSDHFIVSCTQKVLKKCNMLSCNYKGYIKVSNIFLYYIYMFVISLLSRFNLGKRALLHFYRFFSNYIVEKQPPKEKVVKGQFLYQFEGVGMKNNEYISKELQIHGPDPYTTTGICVSQSALILHDMLCKREEGENILNVPGGVLTPGFVFRETNLKSKLKNFGFVFN